MHESNRYLFDKPVYLSHMITIILLVIIYLAFISLGLPDSVLGSAWPSMYKDLNVPLAFAGYASMITAGGTIVSSIFSAKIIRRFGTGIVTSVSVLMTAAALVGISFTRNFYFLCLLGIPLGLGAGSVDAGLNNYVALNYKARHMSWLHCFWGIGASVGPLIMAMFLMNRNSWSLGYRAIGIIQFGLVIILFLSLPLWKNNKDEESALKQKHVKFAKLFQIKGVKYALIAFFCYCTIEMTAGLWGASYLVTVKEIQPEIAAWWISLYYMGITAGRFLCGFITIKLNNKQMVRMGQFIIGAGIVVLVLPFGAHTLLPGFFMIGLGCAPIFPSMLHETPVNFGAENSQAVMGIQMASAYIGATFMPPLFGQITSIEGFGFKVFPIFIGAVLILKIVMTEALNKKIDEKKI